MDAGKQMRGGAALAIYSDLIPEPIRQRAKDYFSFGLEWVPLAASATESKSFTVDSDADFLLVSLNAIASTNGAEQTQVSFIHATLQLADTGSGRQLQNRALHIMDVCGTGQLPGFLPYPKLIPRSSTVTGTLANLVATAINVRISFAGFKIFNWPDR